MAEADALAPPQLPGEFSPRPSAWPSVIGVLGIIYAALGLLGGLCGASLPVWWRAYLDMMEKNMSPDQFAQIQASMNLTLAFISSLITVALAILLLIGSMGVLRRKRNSAGLLKLWAVAQMTATVIFSAITIVITLQGVSQLGGPGIVGGMVGQACGVVLGLGISIFVLIWFSRAEIKAEVATWN